MKDHDPDQLNEQRKGSSSHVSQTVLPSRETSLNTTISPSASETMGYQTSNYQTKHIAATQRANMSFDRAQNRSFVFSQETPSGKASHTSLPTKKLERNMEKKKEPRKEITQKDDLFEKAGYAPLPTKKPEKNMEKKKEPRKEITQKTHNTHKKSPTFPPSDQKFIRRGATPTGEKQPPTHSISQRISDQASSDDEGKLYSKEMEYDNEYVIRETQEDEINEYEENAKRSKELETSLRDFQETIDRRKSPGTNLFDDLSFDSEMLIDARVTTQQAPKGTRMLLPMKGQQHFVPFISSNAISSTPLSRAGAISSSTRKERTFQRRKNGEEMNKSKRRNSKDNSEYVSEMKAIIKQNGALGSSNKTRHPEREIIYKNAINLYNGNLLHDFIADKTSQPQTPPVLYSNNQAEVENQHKETEDRVNREIIAKKAEHIRKEIEKIMQHPISVEEIDIRAITSGPFCSELDETAVAQMKASILNGAVSTKFMPIDVLPYRTEKELRYYVLDGHHRVEAMRELFNENDPKKADNIYKKVSARIPKQDTADINLYCFVKAALAPPPKGRSYTTTAQELRMLSRHFHFHTEDNSEMSKILKKLGLSKYNREHVMLTCCPESLFKSFQQNAIKFGIDNQDFYRSFFHAYSINIEQTMQVLETLFSKQPYDGTDKKKKKKLLTSIMKKFQFIAKRCEYHFWGHLDHNISQEDAEDVVSHLRNDQLLVHIRSLLGKKQRLNNKHSTENILKEIERCHSPIVNFTLPKCIPMELTDQLRICNTNDDKKAILYFTHADDWNSSRTTIFQLISKSVDPIHILLVTRPDFQLNDFEYIKVVVDCTMHIKDGTPRKMAECLFFGGRHNKRMDKMELSNKLLQMKCCDHITRMDLYMLQYNMERDDKHPKDVHKYNTVHISSKHFVVKSIASSMCLNRLTYSSSCIEPHDLEEMKREQTTHANIGRKSDNESSENEEVEDGNEQEDQEKEKDRNSQEREEEVMYTEMQSPMNARSPFESVDQISASIIPTQSPQFPQKKKVSESRKRLNNGAIRAPPPLGKRIASQYSRVL